MLGCAQQEIEAHVRGVTREQCTTTAIDSAKSQTHSAKRAVLDSFHPMGLQFGHDTTANCELAATNRGNDAIQASDTPTTRR